MTSQSNVLETAYLRTSDPEDNLNVQVNGVSTTESLLMCAGAWDESIWQGALWKNLLKISTRRNICSNL